MIWLWYMGAGIEEQTRLHRFGSYPLIDVRDNAVGEYETIFRKEERRGIKVNKLWRNKGHYWKRLNYQGTTRLASFCMEER
ncbi:hypothetical protein F2Q69_00023031 [Brassica cretica]|uniref:Uncharacterized protein n=1 Tax=Brassica cretica TaxID=69181 RepID=A0A8S9Q952_BRACR|nr:hypothetical protein F2Q69_00023031 [Brassica cretica]